MDARMTDRDPSPREMTVRYDKLRRRDRIVKLGDRDIDWTMIVESVTKDGRVRLVNPGNNKVEHYLYRDSPDLQDNDAIKVLRPAAPNRVLHFGPVTLIGTAGNYRTPGGRYMVWTQEFDEDCYEPHPIRTGRGEGILCPGCMPHTIERWCVWDMRTDSYLLGGGSDPADTMKEAVANLARWGELDDDTLEAPAEDEDA